MGDAPQYKVRAYAKLKTATYYGAYSSVLKLTMAKPGTVSALDIAAAENYAKLTWKAAENANGYRVYLYDTKTESFVKKASTTSLSAKITGLKDNTEYKFAVQAYYKDSKGNVTFAEKQETVTFSTTQFPLPTKAPA